MKTVLVKLRMSVHLGELKNILQKEFRQTITDEEGEALIKRAFKHRADKIRNEIAVGVVQLQLEKVRAQENSPAKPKKFVLKRGEKRVEGNDTTGGS